MTNLEIVKEKLQDILDTIENASTDELKDYLEEIHKKDIELLKKEIEEYEEGS